MKIKKITGGGSPLGRDNPKKLLDFLKFLDGKHDIDNISKNFQMDNPI